MKTSQGPLEYCGRLCLRIFSTAVGLVNMPVLLYLDRQTYFEKVIAATHESLKQGYIVGSALQVNRKEI